MAWFLSAFREILFLFSNEIAIRCPDGGAEKRVSERKLRLQKAPEARKLLFCAADQPGCFSDFVFKKIPPGQNKQLFILLYGQTANRFQERTFRKIHITPGTGLIYFSMTVSRNQTWEPR